MVGEVSSQYLVAGGLILGKKKKKKKKKGCSHDMPSFVGQS